MRKSSLPPAKPEQAASTTAIGARKSFAIFALLSLCVLALHPVAAMASERAESAKIPTTIKLKVSATTVKPGQTLTMTGTILPAKATGTVTAYGALKASGPFEAIKAEPVKNGVAQGSEPIPSGFKGTVSVWLKAVYNGSGTYAKSTSNIVQITIK